MDTETTFEEWKRAAEFLGKMRAAWRAADPEDTLARVEYEQARHTEQEAFEAHRDTLYSVHLKFQVGA